MHGIARKKRLTQTFVLFFCLDTTSIMNVINLKEDPNVILDLEHTEFKGN